jgi:nucleoid-associated protein YgaU
MSDPAADPPAPIRARPRPTLAALLGVAVLAGGVVAWRFLDRTPDAAPPQAAAPHAASPSANTPPAEAGTRPSFDIVRVAPSGSAVIAGRAAPGAEVTVLDGGAVLGRVQADDGGNWVLLPTTPLAPGAQELTLATPGAPAAPDGASVVLVVPDRAPATAAVASAAPLPAVTPPAIPAMPALLTPGGDAAPRLLAPVPGAHDKPGLDVVDYDAGGAIRFAGHAPPGSAVRLYIDEAPAGDAAADARGQWTLTPAGRVAAGTHRLRVDQIDRNGRVVARSEVPFMREAVTPEAVASANRVVVQPGQNLWRIARRAYGAGVRYTVIFDANRERISDPRRIFPGQTFDVPALPTGTRPG